MLLEEQQVLVIMLVMAKRRSKMSDRIRRMIDDSGLTRYRLWQETGIDQATLSRFMAGGGLSMDNLDKLADLFDWEITVRAKRRAPKGR